MRRKVTILASGVTSRNAVGGRINAFFDGLTRRGWQTELVEVFDRSSLVEKALDRIPSCAREALEEFGVEGDVKPVAAWRSRADARRVEDGILIVSVPPFSLLGLAGIIRKDVPLVVDYRDPWNARYQPSPLAKPTVFLERTLVRRARAVTFAGGSTLGDLIARKFRIDHERVISVPNGFLESDADNISKVQKTEKGPLSLVFNGYWYGRNGPGILPRAIARVGPSVARMTVIGGVSPPIARQFRNLTGQDIDQCHAVSRGDLYQRISQADAALVTLDETSAIESRIPAKVYDYLAVGVPTIAICPPESALFQLPEAKRFHHVHHTDTDGLVHLLERAAWDRSLLRAGRPGSGPTRDAGVEALHRLLQRVNDGDL